MNIQEALYLFEYVCWILASVAVAYPLIYSLASLGTRKSYYPTAHKQHKFDVLPRCGSADARRSTAAHRIPSW